MRPLIPILSFALLLVPVSSRAALGGGRSSVESDRSALGGEPRAPTSGPGYTVERFDLPGTSVREYVRPDGVVFAVAWEGITHPDLSKLLGAEGPSWRAALASKGPSASRTHRRLVAGGAVVETWGHMRHLLGRALLPALLPPGVNEDEIR